MVFVCSICKKEFKSNYKYTKHLNNIKSCDPEKQEQLKIDKITCQYCKKILSTHARLKTHLEICKSKPNEIQQIVYNLQKQNAELSEKLDKILINQANQKTINITNNVTQQQQNIYNIVPFGKETFDYITKKQFDAIFEQGFRCLQMLIPLIYCNESNPENMNVYISNFNDDKIRIFDGKNWIIEKKDYVLTNMYNSKRDFLELKFEDMYGELSSNAKYFFKRFKAENTNKETIEPILDELKNILYANRNHVIKKPNKTIKNVEVDKKIYESNIILNKKKPKKKITNVTKYEVKLENYDDPNYIPNKPMFF